MFGSYHVTVSYRCTYVVLRTYGPFRHHMGENDIEPGGVFQKDLTYYYFFKIKISLAVPS